MLPPKNYQQRTVEFIQRYAAACRTANGPDPDTAFYQITRFTGVQKRQYIPAPHPQLQTVPYICIQIPTGGGKTYVACHSVGAVFSRYLQKETGLVVWLVPWDSILTQTLTALKDRDHPYRQALTSLFPRGVKVLTVKEALGGALKPEDVRDNLCILVSTLSAFRAANKDGRKVYETNGSAGIMAHFQHLDPQFEPRLRRAEDGVLLQSLDNVIRLHAPMMVLDEGHNAQTELMWDVLPGLNPSFMLEYSATPGSDSNVLVSVPAYELKQEQMVKIPLLLENRTDWRAALRDAKLKRDELEKEAKAERKAGGDDVRPILLLQAEPQSQTDHDRQTVDVVRQFLIDELEIDPDKIKIKTGDRDELGGMDLFAPNCPVRYIITVYALKEGWDCALAYVLVSVASVGERRAVEQLIGRVLRLPYARRKQTESLNRAYVYTVSPKFQAAAEAVRQGLLGNGYSPDDVRRGDETNPDLLPAPRAVKDKVGIPSLAVLNDEDEWEALDWGSHLLEGFDLAKLAPVIDFVPSAVEERKQIFDIDETSHIATEQLTLQLVFREKAFDTEGLAAWLDNQHRPPYFGQKEKRAYFTAVLDHLVAKLGDNALTELTHYRFALLSKLQEHIGSLLESHARKTLYVLKGAGKLASAGEVPIDLPQSISLYPAHPETFQHHLFTRAGKMNRLEAGFAGKLDALSDLKWWYRNRDRQDFGLQGWWGVFYPDFVAKTKSGVYLALEPKGEHLTTAEDAKNKEELGKLWEELSDGQCRFWMVTQETTDVVIKEVGEL